MSTKPREDHCDLPITEKGYRLVELVSEDCETDKSWEGLSAVKTGFEPIILLACRHWRTPVPPEIYIASMKVAVGDRKKDLEASRALD